MKKRIFRIIVQVVGWAAVAGLLIFPVTPLIGMTPLANFNSWSTIGGLLTFGVPLLCFILAWVVTFLLRGKEAKKQPDVPPESDQSSKKKPLPDFLCFLSPVLTLLPLLISLLLISTREIPLSSTLHGIASVFCFIHLALGGLVALSGVIAIIVVSTFTFRQGRKLWSLGYFLTGITTGILVALFQMSFFVSWTGGV